MANLDDRRKQIDLTMSVKSKKGSEQTLHMLAAEGNPPIAAKIYLNKHELAPQDIVNMIADCQYPSWGIEQVATIADKLDTLSQNSDHKEWKEYADTLLEGITILEDTADHGFPANSFLFQIRYKQTPEKQLSNIAYTLDESYLFIQMIQGNITAEELCATAELIKRPTYAENLLGSIKIKISDRPELTEQMDTLDNAITNIRAKTQQRKSMFKTVYEIWREGSNNDNHLANLYEAATKNENEPFDYLKEHKLTAEQLVEFANESEHPDFAEHTILLVAEKLDNIAEALMEYADADNPDTYTLINTGTTKLEAVKHILELVESDSLQETTIDEVIEKPNRHGLRHTKRPTSKHHRQFRQNKHRRTISLPKHRRNTPVSITPCPNLPSQPW